MPGGEGAPNACRSCFTVGWKGGGFSWEAGMGEGLFANEGMNGWVELTVFGEV